LFYEYLIFIVIIYYCNYYFCPENLKLEIMQSTVEISLYPLRDEFIPEIVDFIGRLGKYSSIKTETNVLSTQLFGDFREIMSALTNEMEISFSKNKTAVFILKIVNVNRKS
jgi:uncharacterized protein YqgV (UPF0045/DUF77 family)